MVTFFGTLSCDQERPNALVALVAVRTLQPFMPEHLDLVDSVLYSDWPTHS